MKNILFFTQNRWAFAQIHHALVKRLWSEGVYSHLLDWTISYSKDEMDMLNSKCDVFFTTPEAVRILRDYGIPISKIAAVAHCERDIAFAIHEWNREFFNELHGYGVVNPFLIDVSKQMGVTRQPQVVRIGIDTEHFYAKPSSKLDTAGYAGIMEAWLSHGPEIKRGRLFVRICDELGLNKVIHNNYHHLCMSGFYPKVDAVVVTSCSETVGLPILEGAAAGRLVISAEVGYANGKQGVLCRMEDEDYVTDAKQALAFYRGNPTAYREACHNYQAYVMENHDWHKCINDWLELIYNPQNNQVTAQP